MGQVLIIDLGTTNIKVMAFSEAGDVICESSQTTPVHYGNEIMEIHPQKLWEAVKLACSEVFSMLGDSKAIASVAISSMAASFIPLDSAHMPLHNAIGWNDARSLPYMQKHMDRFMQGERVKNCGQYPLPMYLPFKLQWFFDNHPDLYAKVHKWVNVSEFIYHRLLGGDRFFTDYSIASRTSLFDDVQKKWNQHALDFFHINPDWMATPLPSGTVIGQPGEEAVSIGFPKNTAIVLGGHDHMCACLGAGMVTPGTLLNSTGTSEALVTILSPPYDVEKNTRHWMNAESVVFGDEVAAVAYITASGRVYQSSIESFIKYDAANMPPPMHKPIFIPPQRAQMPSVTGSYIGLQPVFDSQILARITRNGLYYECRRVAERMMGGSLSGAVLRCVGGHTKSLDEMQIKSDVMGLPIEILKKSDISSLGVFLLAGKGCGLFSDIKQVSAQLYDTMEKQVLLPNATQEKLHDDIYKQSYLPNFENGIYSL